MVSRHEAEIADLGPQRRIQQDAVLSDLHFGGPAGGLPGGADRRPGRTEDHRRQHMGRHSPHLCRYPQHGPRCSRCADLGLQCPEHRQYAVPGYTADFDRFICGCGIQDGPVQYRRTRPVPDGYAGIAVHCPGYPVSLRACGCYLGPVPAGRYAGRRYLGRDSRPAEGSAEHQRGTGVYYDKLDRRQPGDLDV